MRLHAVDPSASGLNRFLAVQDAPVVVVELLRRARVDVAPAINPLVGGFGTALHLRSFLRGRHLTGALRVPPPYMLGWTTETLAFI